MHITPGKEETPSFAQTVLEFRDIRVPDAQEEEPCLIFTSLDDGATVEVSCDVLSHHAAAPGATVEIVFDHLLWAQQQPPPT